jgi:predicted nuclease of predicted toxin-antitoxin system
VRWLADECVDAGLVAVLRQAGHDVSYVAEFAPSAADPDILRRALAEARLLLTEDKDFGELVFRLKMSAPGLVLLRVAPPEHALKWVRLKAAIDRYSDMLFGRYLVIEEARFRSRPFHLSGPR